MSEIRARCIYLTKDGMCSLSPDGHPCCYNQAIDDVYENVLRISGLPQLVFEAIKVFRKKVE